MAEAQLCTYSGNREKFFLKPSQGGLAGKVSHYRQGASHEPCHWLSQLRRNSRVSDEEFNTQRIVESGSYIELRFFYIYEKSYTALLGASDPEDFTAN